MSDELNYYRSRAQAERAFAETSRDPKVAAIHNNMAELYDRLIAIEEQREERVVVPFNQSMSASA